MKSNEPYADTIANLTKGATSSAAQVQLLRRLETQAYALASRKLAAFARASWDLVEPGRRFQWNWHLDVICEHLEAVNQGQIKKLVINVPPRTTKSLLVSVFWPAYTWALQTTSYLSGPQVRFLTGSHNVALAVRDAVRSKIIMESAWYQRWFNHWKFTVDQNAKLNYQNNQRGFRIVFGTKTGVTGEGGDILVIDDAHVAVEGMYSIAEREAVINKWDLEVANRVNDPINSARIVNGQRLHLEDLPGHVMKEIGWEVLVLPMEYDPAVEKKTSLGRYERRRTPGELLWPKRFPKDVVEAEKRRLGQYGSAAQLGQSPVPAGGKIIPVEKFGRFDLRHPPEFVEIINVWDTAQKDKEINDPWAGGVWGRTRNNHLYLLEVHRDRMQYPKGKQAVRDMASKHNPSAIVIEDKSTGSSLLQELPQGEPDRGIPGLPCVPFEPEQDKITRMSVESPAIEAGMVHLPHDAPWLFDYLNECSSFPDSATKDQVDMTSMALKWFRESRGIDLGNLDLDQSDLEKDHDGYETED